MTSSTTKCDATLTVLIAGDAPLRATLVEQFATQPGFAALEAATVEEALAAVARLAPQALLVGDDLAAPGAEVLLAAARAESFSGAAILLAGQARDGGHDGGYDACLRRPFRFGALIALLRRESLGRPEHGPDLSDLIGSAGARAALTEKENAILVRLAEAHGATVPRDVLLRDVWGYNAGVTSRTLETHIHRLRRKIESSPEDPRLLTTGEGGYRLALGAARDA
jgi:DNA-binding response OmpR family regulator